MGGIVLEGPSSAAPEHSQGNDIDEDGGRELQAVADVLAGMHQAYWKKNGPRSPQSMPRDVTDRRKEDVGLQDGHTQRGSKRHERTRSGGKTDDIGGVKRPPKRRSGKSRRDENGTCGFPAGDAEASLPSNQCEEVLRSPAVAAEREVLFSDSGCSSSGEGNSGAIKLSVGKSKLKTSQGSQPEGHHKVPRKHRKNRAAPSKISCSDTVSAAAAPTMTRSPDTSTALQLPGSRDVTAPASTSAPVSSVPVPNVSSDITTPQTTVTLGQPSGLLGMGSGGDGEGMGAVQGVPQGYMPILIHPNGSQLHMEAAGQGLGGGYYSSPYPTYCAPQAYAGPHGYTFNYGPMPPSGTMPPSEYMAHTGHIPVQYTTMYPPATVAGYAPRYSPGSYDITTSIAPTPRPMPAPASGVSRANQVNHQANHQRGPHGTNTAAATVQAHAYALASAQAQATCMWRVHQSSVWTYPHSQLMQGMMSTMPPGTIVAAPAVMPQTKSPPGKVGKVTMDPREQGAISTNTGTMNYGLSSGVNTTVHNAAASALPPSFMAQHSPMPQSNPYTQSMHIGTGTGMEVGTGSMPPLLGIASQSADSKDSNATPTASAPSTNAGANTTKPGQGSISPTPAKSGVNPFSDTRQASSASSSPWRAKPRVMDVMSKAPDSRGLNGPHPHDNVHSQGPQANMHTPILTSTAVEGGARSPSELAPPVTTPQPRQMDGAKGKGAAALKHRQTGTVAMTMTPDINREERLSEDQHKHADPQLKPKQEVREEKQKQLRQQKEQQRTQDQILKGRGVFSPSLAGAVAALAAAKSMVGERVKEKIVQQQRFPPKDMNTGLKQASRALGTLHLPPPAMTSSGVLEPNGNSKSPVKSERLGRSQVPLEKNAPSTSRSPSCKTSEKDRKVNNHRTQSALLNKGDRGDELVDPMEGQGDKTSVPKRKMEESYLVSTTNSPAPLVKKEGTRRRSQRGGDDLSQGHKDASLGGRTQQGSPHLSPKRKKSNESPSIVRGTSTSTSTVLVKGAPPRHPKHPRLKPSQQPENQLSSSSQTPAAAPFVWHPWHNGPGPGTSSLPGPGVLRSVNHSGHSGGDRTIPLASFPATYFMPHTQETYPNPYIQAGHGGNPGPVATGSFTGPAALTFPGAARTRDNTKGLIPTNAGGAIPSGPCTVVSP
ncbi:unnamed protein product [Discosporangium mesarthrocarpum]